MASSPDAFLPRRRSLTLAIALLAALLLAVALYVAVGPYLAVRAIRTAVRDNDAAALAGQVDFPALRGSLRAQLQDRMVRAAGEDVQANAFGALGLSIAGRVIDGAVDSMVTPVGLGALMQGRILLARVDGSFESTDTGGQRALLQDVTYRYESPSRFTATARASSGAPVILVLTRKGLRWRLSDLQLPR